MNTALSTNTLVWHGPDVIPSAEATLLIDFAICGYLIFSPGQGRWDDWKDFVIRWAELPTSVARV